MTLNMSSAHVVGDQSAILTFLSDSTAYGTKSPPVRIDTHGAVVFLAGEHAYKMKRAVKFPFMDLSTPSKRKRACEAEIAVNSPNAPSIYLGVVPVTRAHDGLHLGGPGEPIEWLVHMRRFDEQQTLDHLADRNAPTPDLLAKLVLAIIASHVRAPLRDGEEATRSLRRYVQQNADAYAENTDLFPARRAASLTARSDELLSGCWNLLIERGRKGLVRRCHGDLHLRNIVLLEGQPTLFDAVEFDDAIATGDVLYDLAFLLMDLWERGLKNEGNLVFNRYLWASREDQIPGLAALPVFLSIRAGIRAKVIAASLQHLSAAERAIMTAEARRYFAAAETFVRRSRPCLIAMGGLSGTGKTTLAGAIAPQLGCPPGAVHLRSDIERKVLAGVSETFRLPPSTYTAAASAAVYASLRRKTQQALAAGYSVIVDAVHARPAERNDLVATASEAGVPFVGIWLEAPVPLLLERVRARGADASDATEEVVESQAKYDVGPLDWHRLSATADVRQLSREAVKILAGALGETDALTPPGPHPAGIPKLGDCPGG